MTSTEDLLRRSLQARADRAAYEPTPMAEIAARAQVVRQRRTRTTALAVAASVLAVAIPTVALLGADDTRTTQPAAPSPSESQGSEPTFIGDVAPGPPPSIDYLSRSVYVSGDERTTLPLRRIESAAPYQGGYLVASTTAGGDELRISRLDGDLDTVWNRCGSHIVVSRDRTQTAYLSGPCGEDTFTLTLGPTTGAGERTADGVVGLLGILDDGRVVYATRPDLAVRAGDLVGSSPELPWVAGPFDLDEAGAVAVGVDDDVSSLAWEIESGEVLWREPDDEEKWTPIRFSPDGSLLFASANVDHTQQTILDAASGTPVADFELPTYVSLEGVAWEDDEHVLLAVREGSMTAILRADLDGHLTRAAIADEGPTFRFAVQP